MSGTPAGRLLARNTLYNLAGLGAPLLAAAFAIPILLDRLGPERFGLLGLIWVGVAYLNLLELGLGRAATRYAAVALAQDDSDALRETVSVAALSQTALGLAGGALLALTAGPIASGALNLSGPLLHEARWSLIALAAAAPAIAATNAFRGALEADQRFGLINLVRIPIGASNFLVPLLGVWQEWSLPVIVTGLLVVRLAGFAAFAGACLKRWPLLRRRIGFERSRLWLLLRFGGWVTVSGLAGAFLVYADRLLVGALVSVESVGIYTVPHEIVTRLEIMPASLVLTLFPALAAQAHGVEGRRLVLGSLEALLAIVVPVLIALALFANELLTVWLGTDFAAQAAPALRVLAIGMVFNAAAFVAVAAVQATGRPDLTARIHLAELPLHLVLVWLLVSTFGILGAAIAWTVRTGVDALLQLRAAAYVGSLAWLPESRLRRIGGALAVWTLIGAAVRFTTSDVRLSLIAGGGLLLAWAGIVWMLVLRRSERNGLLQLVSRAT